MSTSQNPGGGSCQSLSEAGTNPAMSQKSGAHFTEKQGHYLAFIHTYAYMFGRPPAEADIQRHFRVSPPSVHQMIVTLERNGFIRRQPGVPRSIEILVPPESLPILEWLGSKRQNHCDEPLVQFLEHRIGDKRIIRLIRKWLRAGILEDGVVTVDDRGTGQGSVISPLLANVYLHYCFDLWAERWRRQEAHGDMIIVRYADDLVAGFEHEDDARRFLDAMRERIEAFALTLHSDKTRLIEFGRYAATNRKTRGLGKPETFMFLGFIHICGKSRRGNFLLERKTRRDRLRTKLQDIKAELRRRMHQPIPVQGKWLRQVITGHFAYYAVPANGRALSAFRYYVTDLWRRTLRRRSQRAGFTWDRMTKLADDWLPQPRILHPWPQQRFAVTHPR
ncbi:reverse transcriptase domain-containing protein [Bradyrhizobium sp. 191]|uniref:reverse transcriptase domain-containing protein n=2 Tax=Bradyrhizobium sp. 191 TaxID=2782659 RepID=UPI0020000E82|nr:reverse transcriptase domain-containing protein [Bradyrhizobium sp. 191]